MAKPHTLYAWKLSYFSGKARALLKFKGVNYKEKNINAWDFFRTIPQNTGSRVMPAVKNDVGVWIQDTTELAQYLESRYPANAIYPSSPKQRFIAEFIEAWADEWWIPIAMHYRWSYPENHEFFRKQAGDSMLPWFPRGIKNILANKISKTLIGYLPQVGVNPEQKRTIEGWTEKTLDELEIHFTEHKYLLGTKPSIADFALLGPIGPHLNRDPYPKGHLMLSRPHLRAWVRRVSEGEGQQGSFYNDDVIPTTLLPIINRLMTEFLPMVKAIAELANTFVKSNKIKVGKRLPRAIGLIRFPMNDMPYEKQALPYTLWMVQQCFSRVFRQNIEERQQLHSWLVEIGYPRLLHTPLGPPLKRNKLGTQLAGPHPERRTANNKSI